ncbi:hypothetical protein HYS54_01655 [Candidatus Micrarchaeota archaeon]|nr:hypothetical protein [Candidatus Micrarchaeota archaeon]
MCKSKTGAAGAGVVTFVLGLLALADHYGWITPKTEVPWTGWFVVLAGLYLLYEAATWKGKAAVPAAVAKGRKKR